MARKYTKAEKQMVAKYRKYNRLWATGRANMRQIMYCRDHASDVRKIETK